VYFPDPWWKSRHHKRRVMNEPFVKDIERALMKGGSLHFWTDVEEYYTSTVEILAAHTGLSGPHEVPELAPEDDLDYRTHRERRVRRDGDRVFRSEFKKPG
jgi:tRNA (guanine-N7-)-methyltransferase